jgi:hypothetical protein
MQVGMADHKTWWRNFQSAHLVRLWLAGQDYVAMAHEVRDGENVCIVAELVGTPPRESRTPTYS